MGDHGYLYARLLLQIGFMVVMGALAVGACRWTGRVWAPLGVIVGLGVIVRAWSGLAVFTISYLDLPILSSLHTADGFWHLAPDAHTYSTLATAVAEGAPVPIGAPSPAFVGALALWMTLAGIGPASHILFNLVLHVATCMILVAAFRPLTDRTVRQGAVIALGAFSFSPVLVLVGTQALKDVFFAFLVVCVTVTLFALISALDGRPRRWSWAVPMGAAIIPVMLIAGVRPYYAVFLWGAAALASTLRIVTLPPRQALTGVPKSLVAFVLLWCAFMAGAGEYYPYYAQLVARALPVPVPLVRVQSAGAERPMVSPPDEGAVEATAGSLHKLRQGFVRSGGATNVARPDDERAYAGLGALGYGLATVFVPISLLAALSVVQVEGGQGFLAVTDVDTIFSLLAVLAAVWVVVTSRRAGRSTLPFLAFGVALAVVCAVLLGYVVTNYGTLFRLRLLATLPAWLLPLALTHWSPVRVRKTASRRHMPAELDVAPADEAGRV